MIRGTKRAIAPDSNLQLLAESPLTRFSLCFYGQFLTKTTGLKSLFKWIMRFTLLIAWGMRLAHMTHWFRFSLFLFTAYLAEALTCFYLLSISFKSHAICNYFNRLQEYLDSLKVERRKYSSLIRVIDVSCFMVFLVIQTLTLYLLISSFFIFPDMANLPNILATAQATFLNNWLMVSCSLYALALVGHFIMCDIELERSNKSEVRINCSQLLRLIQRLDHFHCAFEDTFSFLPFLWLSFNWSQATIYLIGSVFGPIKEAYHPLMVTWSVYNQVTAFSTIALAIHINKKVSSKCTRVLSSLEQATGRVILSPNETYLLAKLKDASLMQFTAGSFYCLEKSLVFNYLSSLISFSVLTLQMDTSATSK